MTDSAIEKRYDDVPYPGHPYARSHPDYLATLATLFGLSPPPVERCRVLELGCGCGGNLIPISEALPESECVGIDLSHNQIAEGQAMVHALGLKNILLRRMNILDIDTSLGQFDYIIAHGIYSWVPEQVQDKLLAVCNRNLAPNGIAYVSYNTYPGWHMFGMIRDMMLYHTWDIADPYQRTAQALALLDFLSAATQEENQAFHDFLSSYTSFLKRKMEQAGDRGSAFLLHDELALINTPSYFYQFVNHAAHHGLQYMTEADIPSVMTGNLSPHVNETLRKMARNVIDMEQYLDFLRGRTFRETLLCHHDIRLDRMLKPGRLMSLHVASRARPVSARPDILSPTAEEFRTPEGGTLAIEHPLGKAAMLYLAQIWPRSVPFSTLVQTARSRLNKESSEERESPSMAREEQILAATLLKAYTCSTRLVQFHIHPPHVMQASSERPLARTLARFQALRGDEVTNMYHERVRLDRIRRTLLVHMDGQHDHTALARVLWEGEQAQEQDGDMPVPRKQRTRVEELSEALETHIHWLEQSALIVG